MVPSTFEGHCYAWQYESFFLVHSKQPNWTKIEFIVLYYCLVCVTLTLTHFLLIIIYPTWKEVIPKNVKFMPETSQHENKYGIDKVHFLKLCWDRTVCLRAQNGTGTSGVLHLTMKWKFTDMHNISQQLWMLELILPVLHLDLGQVHPRSLRLSQR